MRLGRFSASGTRLERARHLARVAVLCAAPLLAGCWLRPDPPDPKLDVPGSYVTARKGPDSGLPALDWWRGFGSRELTLLMEEAQTANLDIAAAIARIDQADAQVKIANATLLSQVENAISVRYAKEVIALTTLVTVADAYFNVLDAQDRLRIARENVRASSRILDLIRQRKVAGTASDLEVSQQESLVGQLRAAIPPVEIIARQNKMALAVLVGRAPEHFILAGNSVNRIRIPRIAPGLPSDLLDQRPDIREAEANLKSANFSVEAARAAFFPTIALTGETGFQSLALRTLFGPGAWFYTMAASASQPLFHGGALFGALDQAEGRQLELLQAYRKAVLSAFSDVEQALIAVQQQALRERYQREVVRASQQAFDISYQRLQQGTLDMVTLTQVQQTLFTAQDLLAQIRLARLQAIVQLYQALGGGWSPPERAVPPSAAPAEPPLVVAPQP
jgi:outer membrane protein, multidrug efflux system